MLPFNENIIYEIKPPENKKVKFPPARQEKFKQLIRDLAAYGIVFKSYDNRVFIVKEESEEIPSFDWSKRMTDFEVEISEIYYRTSQFIDIGWNANIHDFTYKKVISDKMYVFLEQSEMLNELTLFQVDLDKSGNEKKHKVAEGLSWAMMALAKLISEKLEAQKGGEE